MSKASVVGKTILDGVVDSGSSLAKLASPAKLWNGKLLSELTQEERLQRNREMNALRNKRYYDSLSPEQKAHKFMQSADSKKRMAEKRTEEETEELRKRNNEYVKKHRQNMSEEDRKIRSAIESERARQKRMNESPEEREARLSKRRGYDVNRYSKETPEQREARLARNREYKARIRGGVAPAPVELEPSPVVVNIPPMAGNVGHDLYNYHNYMANRRGDNLYGRKLDQLGSVTGSARERSQRRFNSFDNSVGSEVLGNRMAYNEASKGAQTLMDEAMNASGLDKNGWDKYMEECTERTGNRQGCFDDFYSGAFKNYAPTAKQIALNPIDYADHPSNIVSSYARSLINGENSYNAPREMKFLNDDTLMKMYQENGDMDAFNEWFLRNKSTFNKNVNINTYKTFGNVDLDLTRDKMDEGLGDMYMSSMDALKDADLSNVSPVTIANNRYNWDLGTLFRREFGGGQKELDRYARYKLATGKYKNINTDISKTSSMRVLGRRNIEKRLSPYVDEDGMLVSPSDYYSLNASIEEAEKQARQKEMESLLNGEVRYAFDDAQKKNTKIQGSDVFDELLKNFREGDGSIISTADNIGMSRQNMQNRLKAVRDILRKRGIIGSRD